MTSPAPLDGGVAVAPVGPPFTFVSDRLLSPSTVSRVSVYVTTGVLGVFGGVRYDPVRREVSFFPNAPELRPGLQYVFHVTDAVRGWDGASLPRAVEVRFVPGARASVPAPRVPSLRREVMPLLAARCADGDCHDAVSPVENLDLSSAAGLYNTAVGIASTQRPGATTTVMTDPHWGPMLRVDVGATPGQGRPAYSYLLYKVLGDGPIVGDVMPPPGRARLSADEAQLLSDWIAAGAPRD